MGKSILRPLRKSLGKIVEQMYERKADHAFKKYLTQPAGKKVYVIGAPNHTNLGDSAITLAEQAFLRNSGVDECCLKEITSWEWQRYQKVIKKNTDKTTLLCWLGGGSMGDQWFSDEKLRREAIRSFPQNPLVIFPQTIFYTDTPQGWKEKENSIAAYNDRQNLTLVAREKISYDMMRKLYPQTRTLLVPDIVLSTTAKSYGVEKQSRSGVVMCMRCDAEKAITDEMQGALAKAVEQVGETYRYTDMYAQGKVTKENRGTWVREKMEELASARLVITDRLHGMVFAVITGTPCIAMGNYNHKVKGTYEWIKYLPYVRYVDTVEEVEVLLPELLAMGECQFDNIPLLPYYQKLSEVVTINGLD